MDAVDEADSHRTLAARVGQLLQDERTRRRLSQTALAERAGVTQQQVSAVERGRIAPTTAMLDRLFAVLRIQVRVDPEPLGSDCDAEIASYERFTDDDRAAYVQGRERTLRHLDGMRFVLTGRFAAFVQGAPVQARGLDLAVVEADLDRWSDWFDQWDGRRILVRRWHPRWNEFATVHPLDPRMTHLPMRWEIGFDEVRFEVGATLPDAVQVACGGFTLPVRPLGELERDYSDLRRLMARARERAVRPAPA